MIRALARVLLAALVAAPAATAADLSLIDTHAHLDHQGPASNFTFSAKSALAAMDRVGIRMSVIEPPPLVKSVRIQYDCDALRFLVKDHPDRFRINGGARLNIVIHDTEPDEVTDRVKARFREAANEELACGIVGFGEIAAHHLSLKQMGDRHPYEWTPPDHPLLLLLADIAAEKGIPIDLHLDLVPEDMPLPPRPLFNPSNPPTLKANKAAFERLLDHNKGAKIIWAHAGSDPLLTKTPKVLRELMSRHPNLYASIRAGRRGAPPPAIIFGPGLRIKPPWIALLRDFPDRFLLGSDHFHPPSAGSPRNRREKLDDLMRIVDQLPPDLARAIGYENAWRLFKLRNSTGRW